MGELQGVDLRSSAAVFSESEKSSLRQSDGYLVRVCFKINRWIKRYDSISCQVYLSLGRNIVALRRKVNRSCQAILVSLVVVSANRPV